MSRSNWRSASRPGPPSSAARQRRRLPWNGIGGFPFRFAATFQDPAIRWRGPREEGAWTGATLHAEMAPWNLRRIEVRSDGQHDASLRLAGDASEWRLAATGFAGAIDLHGSGQLRGFTLALQQPDVTTPDGTVLASAAATVMLDQPETPPTDFNMPLARVTLDLRGLALPPGTRLLTEDAVETLSFDATIKGRCRWRRCGRRSRRGGMPAAWWS